MRKARWAIMRILPARISTARKDDAPAVTAPEEMRPFQEFLQYGRVHGFRQLEASWSEQRAYLTHAVAALRAPKLAAEARQALEMPPFPAPSGAGSEGITAKHALLQRHVQL